ncbi:MAG: hypothetical protein ACK5Y2_08295 [Bdellovibrionales bacterium]
MKFLFSEVLNAVGVKQVNNTYSKDDAFNKKLLVHDLRGLLTPIATSLHCLKSGDHADSLLLQEEILKRLQVIVNQLDHDLGPHGLERDGAEPA